jgi:hypothetical protein
MKKLTYVQKVTRITKDISATKDPVPFLPVMIYTMERGCLLLGEKIPKLPLVVEKATPAPLIKRRLEPMLEPGFSEFDKAFTGLLKSIPDKKTRALVLKRVALAVGNYKVLPQKLKRVFGPPELRDIDPKIIYDAHSFRDYFGQPPPPPPDKVPPKIKDLTPNGIPGAYKANTPFRIIGEGFSLAINDNTIVVGRLQEQFKDPDDPKPPKVKEIDVHSFPPDAAPATTELRATVPSNLQPSEKPYRLRVEVKDKSKIAASNKVDFKIVPNPTVLESPSIIDVQSEAVSGGPLVINDGKSLGPARIIKHGQGVSLDDKTAKVFIEARFIPLFPQGTTVSVKETSGKDLIEHLGASGLKITLPEDMLPGHYQLQLVASPTPPGAIDVNEVFVFDENAGLSNLRTVTIKGPKYQVHFTRLVCEKETSESTPTDEIEATWGCTFDGTSESRPSAQYDVDEGEDPNFGAGDNPIFSGDVGRLLTVSCVLIEVDSGDQAATMAAMKFIAELATAVAGVLAVFQVWIPAAIAAAVAGVAAGVAALISGIGNANDPLGVLWREFDAKALRKAVAKTGKFTDSFTFATDGKYRVEFEVARLAST